MGKIAVMINDKKFKHYSSSLYAWIFGVYTPKSPPPHNNNDDDN